MGIDEDLEKIERNRKNREEQKRIKDSLDDYFLFKNNARSMFFMSELEIIELYKLNRLTLRLAEIREAIKYINNIDVNIMNLEEF